MKKKTTHHIEHVTSVHDSKQITQEKRNIFVALDCTLEFSTGYKPEKKRKKKIRKRNVSSKTQQQKNVTKHNSHKHNQTLVLFFKKNYTIPIVAFSASARKRSCKCEVRKLVSFFSSKTNEEENQFDRSWGSVVRDKHKSQEEE